MRYEINDDDQFLVVEEFFVEYGANQISKRVDHGLPFEEFDKLTSSTIFGQEEWSEILGISERTFLRIKQDKKPFTSLQSSIIIEVISLYQVGLKLFGNRPNFERWLKEKNLGIGGLVPKKLFRNYFTRQQVREILGQYEHGIFV